MIVGAQAEPMLAGSPHDPRPIPHNPMSCGPAPPQTPPDAAVSVAPTAAGVSPAAGDRPFARGGQAARELERGRCLLPPSLCDWRNPRKHVARFVSQRHRRRRPPCDRRAHRRAARRRNDGRWRSSTRNKGRRLTAVESSLQVPSMEPFPQPAVPTVMSARPPARSPASRFPTPPQPLTNDESERRSSGRLDGASRE